MDELWMKWGNLFGVCFIGMFGMVDGWCFGCVLLCI